MSCLVMSVHCVPCVDCTTPLVFRYHALAGYMVQLLHLDHRDLCCAFNRRSDGECKYKVSWVLSLC